MLTVSLAGQLDCTALLGLVNQECLPYVTKGRGRCGKASWILGRVESVKFYHSILNFTEGKSLNK